ncbi:FG-GAP and VCBS repeat-containing protein [Streptomyces sp. DH18]|uniref:FG-GAP and VCBS repeat-containing protein n=1 Tax=Streptomyces sp. DH18 TaxID=3040126 RepID=UPI0024433A8D|nr:FG-GAP and VCBS repeat-containing protein [Streptomyces sp. DH18]MDG9687063.1 FG-GAP and VCBS repeat-containing protein [Streptomyces sp. DH18]
MRTLAPARPREVEQAMESAGSGGRADAFNASNRPSTLGRIGRQISGRAQDDFNGDGSKDLATFVHDDLQVLAGPFTRAGAAASATLTPYATHRWFELRAGDVNGDGRDDVVGASHHDSEDDLRMVSVAAGDPFGGAAAFVDGDKDGRAELAVGAPGENAGEGSLWVVPSMKTGTGSFTFGHGTLGTVAVKAALGSSFSR